MDQLLEAFDTSVNVSFDGTNTYCKHPRLSMYKETFSINRQEERRKQLLKEQKEKKIKVINVKRGIIKKEVVAEIEKELMDCISALPKNPRAYKDVLMLSEWLFEVPDDFFNKWIVVPCPMGRRVLVIADKGCTQAFARKGFKILHKFPSALPGGGPISNKNSSSRLDCIWHEPSRTLYVIDVLELGPNLVDCECQFRFMWLEWKFNEYGQDISEITKNNRFKIVPLKRFPASELAQFVKEPLCPHIKMDGLLFFHEEGMYEEFVKSPLVVWLKPHMVTDVLNLETHSDYMVDKPVSMETEILAQETSTSETVS